MNKQYDMRYLLDRYWITRSENRELYYEIRRALPQQTHFINELLGWNMIANESVIKLEKVPPRSMPWMGIEEFNETMDYCLLCALLLYLADKEDGEQFLLSDLTETIETYMAGVCPVDWTLFQHRKSLVRVLRYAQRMGILLAYDGSSENFSTFREHEVLYENTGLSRHFMVHFGRDISACQSVQDFEAFAWEGDTEHGRLRINRVYRQLALAPAVYWSEGDTADYDYIKNQRQWIEKYLDEALGGELQIYKNGAFFMMSEEDSFGLTHPRDSALCDAVILLCTELRDRVNSVAFPRTNNDMAVITHREFRLLACQCREKYGKGWGKQLRELSDEKYCQALLAYMTEWMLLQEHADYLLFTPAAGKWIGRYPKDYNWDKQENNEVENVTTLENA